jgi:hypothetical protein
MKCASLLCASASVRAKVSFSAFFCVFSASFAPEYAEFCRILCTEAGKMHLDGGPHSQRDEVAWFPPSCAQRRGGKGGVAWPPHLGDVAPPPDAGAWDGASHAGRPASRRTLRLTFTVLRLQQGHVRVWCWLGVHMLLSVDGVVLLRRRHQR